MKLGFVFEDGLGGVKMQFCDVDEHDVDEHDGFRAAVSQGCAAVGWTRTEWDFRYPAEELACGHTLIMCRPKGGTPVLPAFGGE